MCVYFVFFNWVEVNGKNGIHIVIDSIIENLLKWIVYLIAMKQFDIHDFVFKLNWKLCYHNTALLLRPYDIKNIFSNFIDYQHRHAAQHLFLITKYYIWHAITLLKDKKKQIVRRHNGIFLYFFFIPHEWNIPVSDAHHHNT